MDVTKNAVQLLKKYAVENIQNIAVVDKSLTPLIDALYDPSVDLIKSPDPDKVRQLTNWMDEKHIPRVFNDQEMTAYKKVVELILEIATNPKSNNKSLCLVSEFLYPVLSQDERFIKIGWDLCEYMDWYFKDTTYDERMKYAEELRNDWGYG